jgi:phytoene/squalene synthetase
MELYDSTSYVVSETLTKRYSTSFSMSSRLFSLPIRPHIYAIYGMVRLADEIVDSYGGDDREKILNEFERETMQAIERRYSTNPLLHAFSLTANKYGIGGELVRPFFASMSMDITPTSHTSDSLAEYIYGSAEVVGLMCLRVFTDGDTKSYDRLAPGARALGSAYQKVNFLRDIAADHDSLGRWYFATGEYDTFTDEQKREIVRDIASEFDHAKQAIAELPPAARPAVQLSYQYYRELLRRIEHTPAQKLRTTRIRVPTSKKLWLYLRTKASSL